MRRRSGHPLDKSNGPHGGAEASWKTTSQKANVALIFSRSSLVMEFTGLPLDHALKRQKSGLRSTLIGRLPAILNLKNRFSILTRLVQGGLERLTWGTGGSGSVGILPWCSSIQQEGVREGSASEGEKGDGMLFSSNNTRECPTREVGLKPATLA